MKNNKKDLKCSVNGCNRPVKIFKHCLCDVHAMRLYRDGTPGLAKINVRRKHEPYKAGEQK